VRHRASLALALTLLGLTLAPTYAGAAGPPQVPAAWVTEVTASGATLRAEINPEGTLTRYRFEYLSEAAYEANLAASPPREGFSGALKAPATGIEPSIGAGNSPEAVNQHIGGLTPLSTYRYRVRATSSAGTSFSDEETFTHTFTTQGTELVFSLPDDRGWEMVSPVDKNGGAITSVGSQEPRVFQAAADGNSATYDSISSFAEPQGAPSVSQYLSKRGGGGWSTEDVTIPLFSGSYGDEPAITPYALFSPDLSQAIVRNGERCRGTEGECANANPPLPGSGAPAGYANYYRRDSGGGFTALLTQADVAGLALDPQDFEVQMVASSPDLGHVVLSSCAALTDDATEVHPFPGPCADFEPNLYEFSAAGPELVNVLPGDSEGSPGAEIAAQGAAVSSDGSRVYWTGIEENLYLHRRGQGSVQVDTAAGGGGSFQTASADGAVAYFSKEGHLYRYLASSDTATDLTPGGEVLGVLGASDDGSYVYFLTSTGLQLWHGGTTTQIAAAVDASNYPPATGTARISPDGTHLAFLSSTSLTGYDNAGKPEVFLYGPPPSGGAAALTCVSCNPTGERPAGPSTIPGAVANGSGAGATNVYKPRALSADGSRVFFDTEDALVVQDSDKRPDVYEWEAAGTGTCPAGGSACVNLISSGRSLEGASFVDASADGSDAFFLTDGSLVPSDPGSVDLYDAREGGGFPTPPTPVPCIGDACQPLPPAPEDPTPGTLVPNPGNPVQPKPKKPKKKKHHKKKHGNTQGKGAKRRQGKGAKGRAAR